MRIEHYTPPQWAMLQNMIERQVDRLRYQTELVDVFPSLRDIEEYVYVGSFSWTCPRLDLKWLNARVARNIGAGHCSPSDIARDYLSVKFGAKRRRVTTAQYHVIMRHVSPPLYAVPCELYDAVYVDLQSAYWSILQVVGWDVEYFPQRWLAKGASVRDFPVPGDKLARNCLVSIVTPGAVTVWDGSQLTQKQKPNTFANMVLWRLVQDVLNGVAADMIRAGALYVHTDGYIFPSELFHRAEEVAASWGLRISVKNQGRCAIRNVGFYDFANSRSKRNRRTQIAYHAKVYDPGNNWLRPRFEAFSSHVT